LLVRQKIFWEEVEMSLLTELTTFSEDDLEWMTCVADAVSGRYFVALNLGVRVFELDLKVMLPAHHTALPAKAGQ
jgi:hypothetical protein